MQVTSFNEIPKNATCTTVLVAKEAFPDKASLYQPTFHDLIAWLQTGKILPYENNRAGVPLKKKGKLERDENNCIKRVAFIAPKTFKSVTEEFAPLSFGEISLALQSDGTLKFSEGESRTTGMMRLYWGGKFPAEALEIKTSVRVVPAEYHNKDYINRGKQSGHTTRQRVNNPDLVFGHIINDLLYSRLSDEAVQFYVSAPKLSNIISYLCITLNENPNKDWDFTDMYWLGKAKTKELINAEAGSIDLEEEDLDLLAYTLESYVDYYKKTQDQAGPVMKVRSLFTDNGWFGLYMTDRITEGGNLAESNLVLAKQTMRNFSQCKEGAPLLGGTTSKAMIQKRCNGIFKTLRRKSRAA